MFNFYQDVRKVWGVFCLTLLFCASANGQIALTTSPYTQNFDGISAGLPTGWEVRTGGNATALGTTATLVTAATAWNSTTGNFRNCASANALTSTATTVDQSGAIDRALAVRQTGSVGDPGASFLLQLSNTTLKNSFNLSFKLQSLDPTTPTARTVAWTVSYGIGSAPTSFTTVTTSPASLSTTFGAFANTSVTVNFGNALDNQTQPIWIRIHALTASTGSGSRPTSAIDDVSLSWTDLAGDNTAPTFTATFPKVQNVNNTTLDILSNLNEAGKTYFVILPDGATAPTSAQVKAGQDATNNAVANNLKGTINHTSANADFMMAVTGLTSGTAYDIYAVAEDLVPNVQTNPTKIDVTTTSSDLLAPTFANTYPKVSAVMLTTFTLSSNINEVGKAYFVIVPDNATAPTSAQVKAGQDATNTTLGANLKGMIDHTSANTEFTANITGLTEATAYDVYVVAEDLVPNVQASPMKIDVLTNTSDNVSPNFTATYPKTSTIGSTSFALLTNIDEVGKTYFVVLPDNATAPTSAQVKAGQNSTGTTLANNLKGTINNLASATEYSVAVAGLTASTAYDVYVVAEDAPAFNAPNLQTNPTKIDVATIAPSNADVIEDFTVCTTGTNISSWTRFSAVGAQEWSCTTSGKTGNGARMNGFATVNNANEDWLISPAFDLSAFTGPNFSFWSASNFVGDPLTLRVSTNYTSGDPTAATWITLTAGVNFPTPLATGTGTNWTESLDIDLTAYKSSNTRLAFVYTSTATNGTRWTIDDLKVYNKAPQIILTKAQTLDVVTWNLEWFGDSANGPTDEVLQRNNIKSVIQQIDADIYCLQEVTNQNLQNSFQTLVTELASSGYSGIRVTHTSSFGADAQQSRAFIYKTGIFSNVTTEVLALSGAWADGRQPVIFKGDATIEGTTKTMYFVNIHAKALSAQTDFDQRQANSIALKTYLDANRASDNVVFLGDFNDDLDMSFVTPNVSPYKNFVDDVTNYATPSKTALSDNNITTFIGQTTPIDHIILSNEVNTMYYNNSLKREDYTSTIPNYSTTTTDHYPVSIRLQIGTVTPDVTAPTFTATYPKVSEITTSSFKVESAINEAGKTYYVVVANNASAPNAAQVKAGLDGTGNPLAGSFKGTLLNAAPNLPASAQVTGITILTDYDVYFVAEDEIPNLQTNPTKIDVTAAPADITPPNFTANYPKADQIASGSFRLISNLNDPGKTFFVVLPNNANAPTSAQVKAGQDATGTAVTTPTFIGNITNSTANNDFNATVSGANINTDYDVYFVAEDLFNNLQANPTKVDVKTIQLLFTSGYPKVDQITSNQTSARFRLVSSLAEAGKTYFVVLPNNANAPTSAQVKAGQDATGNSVNPAFLGTLTNSSANVEVTANIIGADLDTDYDVYFVAENASGALQPAPVKIDVRTPVATSAEDDLTRYLNVYPNPTQDRLAVTLIHNPILKQAQARLVNVFGNTVQNGKLIHSATQDEYLFDVRSLPSGIYLLELQDGKRKFFRKIVVR